MSVNVFFDWPTAVMAGKAGHFVRRTGWTDRWLQYYNGLWWLRPGTDTPHVVKVADFGRDEFQATDWTNLPPECVQAAQSEAGQTTCPKPFVPDDPGVPETPPGGKGSAGSTDVPGDHSTTGDPGTPPSGGGGGGGGGSGGGSGNGSGGRPPRSSVQWPSLSLTMDDWTDPQPCYPPDGTSTKNASFGGSVTLGTTADTASGKPAAGGYFASVRNANRVLWSGILWPGDSVDYGIYEVGPGYPGQSAFTFDARAYLPNSNSGDITDSKSKITPAGTPNVADTLSLTSGTWTGYGYTTTYQWKRAGAAIAGATTASYTLSLADAGQAITCSVTRTNVRGAATATTAATASVTNLIAVNTAIPTLSTTLPYTGVILTCSPGTWNYHPTSYGYQWRRNGTAISGATGSTYTVVVGDVGTTLSCAVTATNPAGTSGAVATAESSAVATAAISPIRGALADSSLIAHWSLDEASGTRYDLTTNSINLTPYANGGTIINATGKFGMAASIPARSYLAATDSRIPTIKTICGWFKLSATNTSYQRLLIASLQVYSGSSGIAWDKTHFTTGIAPTPGQWYFVCLVFTGTTVKLWVNNQSFVVQNSGTPLIDSGSTFTIGDPNYESVTMLFDEVACWNRALTDAEITTLVNA